MHNSTIKMLSIDDKSLTTNLDRAGYRKMGVQVTASNSFHDAVETLQRKDIDVIVINMDFQDIDATGIITHLKADERWSETAIVVTSVRSSASVRKKALAAGADLFMEQPLPRTFFIEKIKNLLEQQTRSTARVSVHGDVRYSIGSQDHADPIGDLSNSGMLISTDLNIEDGASVNLSFTLPGYKKELKVKGEVVRTIKADSESPNMLTGLGVRFVEYQGDSQKRLENYVSKSADHDSELKYYL